MTSEEVYKILCKIITNITYDKLVEVDKQGFV